MEPASDETRTLRRTMRDLVALSALPAVWAGYRPHQVAEGLADVLRSTLRLDLVYIRLPGRTQEQGIEVARTEERMPRDQALRIVVDRLVAASRSVDSRPPAHGT